MLTPRPLALALLTVLSAGFLTTPAHAAKKPAAKKTAPHASACTDFYAEANKGWLIANPLPEHGSVSALGQMSARSLQQQRDLLEKAASAPQNNVQKLLGDFWASGLDEAAIERDGAAPIAPLLKRIDSMRKTGDVAPAIAALHQVGIPVAFQFGADVDLRDLNRHLGYFSQGGVGLPDPAYYTRNDADTQALIARYADYIRAILALTGVPAKDIEAQTALVLDLEKRIAAKAKPLAELRDPRNNFAPVATAELGKQYKNLRLDAFLQTQSVSDDTVSIANPAMLTELDQLVTRLKPVQWQAYLRWRIGDAMAPFLSKPWRDASFNFRGKILLGKSAPAPLWQQTLDAINLAAGPMLGREYAASYLSDASRKQAEQIAEQVLAVLKDRVASSTRFSEAAKAEASKKLGKLKIEVGTPPYDLDYSVQPMGRGSFGSNILIASTWRHAQEMKRIGKSGAARRWDVLPQQPALAYDLAHNRLIVTAAMLQTPVLDLSMPQGNRYGAFGALVGHELSHAVDGLGRHIDADGNIRDWWQPSDVSAWDAVTAKVTALYSNLPYPGLKDVKLNSDLTRNENLADIAGLELAKTAADAANTATTQRHKEFYTGWAQLWAQQVPHADAEARSQQDVRAPGLLRTNIPLMQQPAFGEAYGCRIGAAMRPKEQVRLFD